MPSLVRRGVGGSELMLGTSGGVTETGPAVHPYFFRGFLAEPGPAAAGMLACAAVADLPAGRVTAALSHLAAAGRVGYDLADEAFFHRELPFGAALEMMHPRLADARALISSGSVTPTDGGALVRSGEVEHRVTFAERHDTCTCPWWGKHRGTRGPCKHVLAARMAAEP